MKSSEKWNWIFQVFAGPPQCRFRRDPPDDTLHKRFGANHNLVNEKSPVGMDFHFGMTEKTTWKIWCEMDFHSYPLDKQVCITPRLATTLTLKVFWIILFLQTCIQKIKAEDDNFVRFDLFEASHIQSMGSNQQNHGNLDYDVSVLLQKHKESGDIVLEISLQRHFLRGFIELIAPPALLVMVSWVKNNKNLIRAYFPRIFWYLE